MSKKSQSDQAAAAQIVAAAAAADGRRRKLVAIVAGLLVLVVLGYLWSASRTKPAPPARDVPTGVTKAYGVKYGAAGGPEVVIYEDFLCPFCGELEREHLSGVVAAADDGRASVEYRPINLLSQVSDYSMRATNAYFAVLDAAGPEAAAKFHEALFANQPAEDGDKPDDDWLVEQAVAAGADEAKVRESITKLKFEDYVTNATESVLLNDKISGTPTVYLDGKQVEGSLDEIDAALTEAIAGY